MPEFSHLTLLYSVLNTLPTHHICAHMCAHICAHTCSRRHGAH